MIDYEYIQKPAELEALVGRLLQKPDMTLSLDTETTGLDPLARRSRVLLCQIGTPEGEVFVINAAKLDLSPLQPVFAGRRVAVLQNAKFDVKWLWAKYGLRIPQLFDTMLAELLLNAGLIVQTHQRRSAASLKSLSKKYLGLEMQKEVRKEFIGYLGAEFTKEQLDYAAEDVPHLFTIKEEQARQLQMASLIDVAKLEFAVVYAVARMELNGLGIDRARYETVIDESADRMGQMDVEIREYLRKRELFMNLFDEVDINLNSIPQLKQAFTLLGCPVPDTESKTLKRCPHPFAALMLEYRDWETQVSTFGLPVIRQIHPETGRLHPEFEQLGADSGRFSCNRPNIQQIPKEARFRSNFVAARGRKLVIGDWSQFELRILCYFSKDRNMLEAFEAGRDLHSDTAARMYGLNYEDIDKHHPARGDAKILNFALAYGMGVRSLADNLKCEESEAKAKRDRYFSAYPGVKDYLEQSAKDGVRNLETRTVSGRRRLFTRPEAGEDYKKQIAAIQRCSKNTPIQGSNGDALKRAMIMVQRRLDEKGWTPGLVACVHDEIVLEVPANAAEEAGVMLEEEMISAGEFYLPGVPIKADVGTSHCWEK